MTKDKSPVLSIIMPTFNHEKELAVMIESIIHNTYTDWELLAVDDGSDEPTLRLLLHYAQEDNRIRLLHRDRLPKGAPTCRNIGMNAARGEYVVFFDSDDYVTSGCLSRRISEMQAHPELDFMVFPSGLYMDNDFKAFEHKFVFGYKTQDDDLRAFARRELPFIVWNNIYRAEAIRQHHLHWNENLLSLQDAEYNIAAITKGLRYDYAQAKPDYGYRLYITGSISRKVGSEAHYTSHKYYLESVYKMIQQMHGHRYDEAIYNGILLLLNSISTGQGYDYKLAAIFAKVLKQYSPLYYRRFCMKTKCCRLLEKVMSPKLARQLVMVSFLVQRDHNEKKRIKTIKTIIQDRLR